MKRFLGFYDYILLFMLKKSKQMEYVSSINYNYGWCFCFWFVVPMLLPIINCFVNWFLSLAAIFVAVESIQSPPSDRLLKNRYKQLVLSIST